MLKLDEMQPLSDNMSMLLARAIVLAHRDAAKTNYAEIDDIRKQECVYIEAMLQRARWNKTC